MLMLIVILKKNGNCDDIVSDVNGDDVNNDIDGEVLVMQSDGINNNGDENVYGNINVDTNGENKYCRCWWSWCDDYTDVVVIFGRARTRNGLRILGASNLADSPWQITVDVNERQKSATVTATLTDTGSNLERVW